MEAIIGGVRSSIIGSYRMGSGDGGDGDTCMYNRTSQI